MDTIRPQGMIRRVTAALDGVVATGLIPGWTAAVEVGGHRETASGGWADLETRRPMSVDTVLPIASLSKPVGAVLVLQLVRDGELALDDPVSRWLPEFARPRVLRTREAPIEDTVEAVRPITVRHLLTMTSGIGMPFGGSSVADEMARRGMMPGRPTGPPPTGDELMAALADLPLQAQPGEGWFYHFSTELLSVLLERATGTPLDQLVEERVARPLGLGVLAFHGPSGALARGHHIDAEELVGDDPAAYTRPPVFRSLGGGLVSTVGDYCTFLAALAREDERLGDGALLRELRSPQLSPEVVESAGFFLEPSHNYGFQVAVATRDRPDRWAAGRFGWSGGTGTQAYADPGHDLVAVVFTNRAMTSATSHPAFGPFWDAVYAA